LRAEFAEQSEPPYAKLDGVATLGTFSMVIHLNFRSKYHEEVSTGGRDVENSFAKAAFVLHTEILMLRDEERRSPQFSRVKVTNLAVQCSHERHHFEVHK
jgi:hypothetical protein